MPLMAVAAVFLAAGCSSGAPESREAAIEPTAVTASGGPSEEQAPILRPEATFNLDQLAAAGWKKSKQFPTDTLPAAVDAWYGFYDRKDIEVRVYRSHGDAKGPGAESALAAIGRSPNSNIGGGIITSAGNRTQYHAYVVAGNLVLLCERAADICVQLVQQLP